MGTAIGTKIFVQYGWRAAASFALASYGAQLVILLVRGPRCKKGTWIGYEGGIAIPHGGSQSMENRSMVEEE